MSDSSHILDVAVDLLETYGVWLAVGSLLMLVASLVVIRILLVRIPADYFIAREPHLPGKRHPALETAFLIGKNILGLLLVILGLVMTLPGVAGQGVLTILAGASLMNFPGKRRLIRAIVGRPLIESTINGIRRRAGKPPLILDEVPTVKESVS